MQINFNLLIAKLFVCTWRDPVGWEIFNFVNFENWIHMKLYSLLILTKNTKKSKTILKHRKRENSYISRLYIAI